LTTFVVFSNLITTDVKHNHLAKVLSRVNVIILISQVNDDAITHNKVNVNTKQRFVHSVHLHNLIK